MPSTLDEFFQQAVMAAHTWARIEQRMATDPLTLSAYGMSDDVARDFIRLIKPLAEADCFRVFLEHAFLKAYQELFCHIDGITGNGEKSVNLTDLNGHTLSKDLNGAFADYLETHGFIR